MYGFVPNTFENAGQTSFLSNHFFFTKTSFPLFTFIEDRICCYPLKICTNVGIMIDYYRITGLADVVLVSFPGLSESPIWATMPWLILAPTYSKWLQRHPTGWRRLDAQTRHPGGCVKNSNLTFSWYFGLFGICSYSEWDHMGLAANENGG